MKKIPGNPCILESPHWNHCFLALLNVASGILNEKRSDWTENSKYIPNETSREIKAIIISTAVGGNELSVYMEYLVSAVLNSRYS